MNCFSLKMESDIRTAFLKTDLNVSSRGDHFVVPNSKNESEKSIRRIVEKLFYYPIVSRDIKSDNFLFTVAPYRMPSTFLLGTYSDSIETFFSAEENVDQQPKKNLDRFCFFDLYALLHESIVEPIKDWNPGDRWQSSSWSRDYVRTSLNKGVHDIVARKTDGSTALVEIGAGKGYSLLGDLFANTLRIQPDDQDYQLLALEMPKEVFHLDIEKMCDKLKSQKKTISVLFGLNVFDTMLPEERRANFKRLSALQAKGDHLVALLDTNPCLNAFLAQLSQKYPNCDFFPYFPLKNRCAKASALVVPKGLTTGGALSCPQWAAMMNQIGSALNEGQEVPQFQKDLHTLKKKLNLEVIVMEEEQCRDCKVTHTRINGPMQA